MLEGNYRYFFKRLLDKFRPFMQLSTVYSFGRLDESFLFSSSIVDVENFPGQSF
jgi:hypothetical protein